MPESIPDVDVKIVDGATLPYTCLIQRSRNNVSKHFEYYSQWVFLPYMEGLLHNVVRVDVICDVYRQNRTEPEVW